MFGVENEGPEEFALVDGTSHGRIDLIKMKTFHSVVHTMPSNVTEEFVWQTIEWRDERWAVYH